MWSKNVGWKLKMSTFGQDGTTETCLPSHLKHWRNIRNSDFQILDIQQWRTLISDQWMRWALWLPLVYKLKQKKGKPGRIQQSELKCWGCAEDKVATEDREEGQLESHTEENLRTSAHWDVCVFSWVTVSIHTWRNYPRLRTKSTRNDQRGNSPKLKQTETAGIPMSLGGDWRVA